MKRSTIVSIVIVGAAALLLIAIVLITSNGIRGVVHKNSRMHISTGVVTVKLKQNPQSPLRTLEPYMQKQAKKDLQYGCEKASYIVKAVSSDDTQVLVQYGCELADASMFAIYNKDNEWLFVSPTNQFDAFGIPDCGYVKQHTITNDIAPVCQTIVNNKRVYTVR